MDMTRSVVCPAVEAYLGGGEMNSTELMALQAYQAVDHSSALRTSTREKSSSSGSASRLN
jgi:hypothetical protein